MSKVGSIVISQGEQQIVNNRTYITVTGVITTSGESYRGDHNTGTISVVQGSKTLYSETFTHGAPANSTTTLFTIGLWVNHDSLGNSGTIAASYNYSSGWCSASASKVLTPIPRQATITSAPNFNDEENPIIKYSNPDGNQATSLQACISLDGSVASIVYRDVEMKGTQYQFILTDEEREVLRVATTGSNKRKVYFLLKTVLAGTAYVDKEEREFSIINGEPTLAPTVKDVNEKTLALTGSEGVLVRYFSNAEVAVNAEAKKSATIVSQKVICGNQSITETSGTIEGVGSGNFVFSVTDSRGNTVPQSVPMPLVEYVNLTCNLSASAPDGEGDMVFTIGGNCFSGSFGAVDNTVRAYYRYKEGDGEYCDWTEAEGVVLSNNTYSVEVELHGLNYQAKHTFQAMAEDELMALNSAEVTLKTIPVFDWSEFDFNFNVPVSFEGKTMLDLVYPVGSLYMSTNETNPSKLIGGEWEQVKDRFLLAAGDTYKAGTTGGKSTHTMTVNEMPSHNHNIKTECGAQGLATLKPSNSGTYMQIAGSAAGTQVEVSTPIVSKGGGKAFDIMPPYLAVYVWRRTA